MRALRFITLLLLGLAASLDLAAAAPRLRMRPAVKPTKAPTSSPASRRITAKPRLRVAPRTGQVGLARAAMVAKLAPKVTPLRWTTKLLVHNAQSNPSEVTGFVAMNDFQIDWNSSNRFWWFSWESKAPAASVVWQVSTLPPPQDFLTWKKPAGMIASQRIAPGNHRFKIDFSPFAPTPNSHGAVMSPTLRRAFLKAVNGRLSVLKKQKALGGAEATRLRGWAQKPGLRAVAASGAGRPTLRRTAKTALRMRRDRGAPPARWHYYVRVVLLDGQGRPISISGARRMRYGEPDPQTPVQIYDVKPTEVPFPNPCLSVKAYTPIRAKWSNYYYHWLVVKEPTQPWKSAFGWKIGDHLDFSPKEKSFWDKVGDAISSVVDFFSGAVDWVAEAYEWVKARAVDAACAALPGVPREWIEAGLDAGLASMGIPPSLPNFDELTSMGKDYLVATVAEQAGIPPEIAGKAVDELVKKAGEAASGPGNGAPMNLSFVRLLPRALGGPARLDLLMVNRLPQRTFPALVVIRDSEKIFQERYVHVPALERGQSLSIPVNLTPNDWGHCYQSPDAHPQGTWDSLYATRPTRFSATVMAGVSLEKVAKELGLQAYGGMGFTWKALAIPTGWNRVLPASKAWTAPTSFKVPKMKR